MPGGRFVLLLLAVLSPAAFAANAYVDEVLTALERKGLLSAQEVHDIKLAAREAERREQAAVVPTPGAAAPTPAAAPATPLQQAAAALPKPPEALRVWGRLQPRYTYIPAGDDLDGTASFTFRRARIGFKGPLNDQFYAYTQYEAANETPALANADSLLDVWIRYNVFADTVGDLIVGQQFIPGYGRAPQLSASVERKFPEFLGPGTAGRARGIVIERGKFGAPETLTDGVFGDRLQFGAGIFNGPDVNTNNDNNELLYSVVAALTPLGMTVEDEYEIRDLPFRYLIGAGYSWSRDSGSADARVQNGLLGRSVTLDNAWWQAFGEWHARRWFGWASWTQFVSQDDGGPLARSDGVLDSRLRSRAWAAGVTRTFPLAGARHWALGLQYQQVDNQHPSRTRFMRVLTGSSADELARGMDQGQVFQLMATYIFTPNIRLLNEYAWFDSDAGIDYGGLVSQLQVDF